MSKFLSLSRAARLVDVTRSELQRKIQLGELIAFEGVITLDNLLVAYPDAQLEDNTEYSRLLFIKERAFGKRVFERVMPDVETLVTRVNELSKELTLSQAQVKQFNALLERLRGKLGEIESQDEASTRTTIGTLKYWLADEVKFAMEHEDANPLAVRDNLLRVMSAHVSILPSGHDFFIEGHDTLLEGALRAGVPINYGCSGGNCGLCKAKVVSGQIKKTRLHDYMLTEVEKSQGYALMCSNTAVTDVEVEANVAGSVQDIPLQHISDNILKSMRRGTTKEKTTKLLKEFREAVPGMTIRTTLIVGYPGETEEDFQIMKDWVQEMKFERLGCFAYSHEENTHAYLLEDDVPEEVKQARAMEIMDLQSQISWDLNQEKVGQTFKCIIDRKEGQYFVGRTEFDSPDVDNEVLIDASKFYVKTGEFVDVKIIDATEFDLYGEPA